MVAVRCQLKEWIVAVTEQRDETGRRVRRGRPKRRGNYWKTCACLTRLPLKAKKRMKKSTVAC